MIGVIPPILNAEKRTSASLLIGSEVAGREFVLNMARFLPPASVGLIVPDLQVEQERKELLRFAENEGGNYRSTAVIGLNALPDLIQKDWFTVLHNLDGSQLHQATYLRARFAGRAFPITCLTHGFSYQYALWSNFARLLPTPTLVCDAVVCSSQAARQAFRNLLIQVQEGLVESGIPAPEKQLRIEVLPLGVDTDLYQPRDKQDVRRLLGLPQDKVLLLYFGRIAPASKGDICPLLLVARQLFAKHKENLVLVLAGAANDQAISQLNSALAATDCASQTIVRLQPSLIEAPLKST